jgi:sugar-specific transcriptional regulator TrmB
MSETEDALIGLGLTRTEAKIYLTGLASDALTVQEIGHKTKIKRPTIYHAIGTLTEKGLVSERKKGGKIRYSMCPPDTIRGLVEEQRQELEARSKELEELIPLLVSQIKPDGDGASVVQYSGWYRADTLNT